MKKIKKPERSDDKYWDGTRYFESALFENDLQEYIFYLEAENETLIKFKDFLIQFKKIKL